MAALRLMTFNVQMLPWLGSTVTGQTNDAPERAHGVADAIESLAPAERPHVIAFNEVFDEDGRDVLLSRLSGSYPHIVKKIDDGGVLEDSGLMLFSSLGFHTLPNGEVIQTGFFTDSAGTDAMSNKGFGIVQIGAPAEVTTLVFTHAQAAYTVEDEHRDVRAKQFDQIREAVDNLLGSNQPAWQNVIFVGDLNVRGDSGSTSDEWTTLVEQGGSRLFERLDDGWRTYMHPPDDLTDYDPGHTNINYATGARQRLDYQCVPKASDGRNTLVPHHLRVRLRHSSDHFALEGVIQQWSAHCTPSAAIKLLDTPPVAATQPEWPTEVRSLLMSFADDGSYQWLWVERPGTFSIFTPPDVVAELYGFDDLSRPLDRLDTVNVAELPPVVRQRFRDRSIDPDGATFASRGPFFIALRLPGDTGSRTVIVLEHRGETPATAIRLRLHDDVETGFPEGQRLGDDDTCWFKATPAPSFGGLTRTEVVTVANPTGGEIKLARCDTAFQPVDETSGSSAELRLEFDTAGGESVYFAMRRADDTLDGFTLHWDSPMSYLDLDEPLGLYIDDESGIDAFGDDELIMSLSMDGASILNDATWDEADAGERWPGLADAVKQKLWAQLPGRNRIGFVQSIDLSYVEDDFTAQGFQLAGLKPLGKSEPVRKERRVNMPVPDGLSDGRYTFYCTITKLE